MPLPIDYTRGVKSPFEKAIAGFTAGQNVALRREQMAELGRQRDQATRMQTDLTEMSIKPGGATADDYKSMMIKYPQMSQHFKSGWDILNSEQQQSTKKHSINVFSALQSNKPEVAKNILTERAIAARNSGREEEAKAAEAMIGMVDTDPNMAKTAVGLQLSSIMGKDFTKLAGAPRVRASKILDDGTLVQSTDTGIKVFAVTGEELTGDLAQQAIEKAGVTGVKLAGAKAGEKETKKLEAQLGLKPTIKGAEEAAKSSIKMGEKAYTQLQVARRSMQNIDDALAALDQGASTGYLQKFFPNITAATNELINARARMGLDIIADVTFGALSESELKFALDTAMPTRLSPPELKDWLNRKKAAQEVVAGKLEDAAKYLSTPGNNLAGWIELQQQARQPTPAEETPVAPAITPQPVPAVETPAPAATGIDALLQKYGGK